MDKAPDLRCFLASWPYDPANNVRLVRGADGREIILVRQPLGLEEYEVDGRPDGKRPYGMESAFDFQLLHLAGAKQGGLEQSFQLTVSDCLELFNEAAIYCHRLIHFFHLGDWVRAERDSARNLR